MQLSKSKIVINWQSEGQTSSESSEVLWTHADIARISTPKWEDACRKLFDNALVAKVLEGAFVRGLGRKESWTAHADVSNDETVALAQAAKIYKRGVICNNIAPMSQTSGESNVEFFETLTQLLTCILPTDTLVVDTNVHKSWSHELPANTIAFTVTEAQKDLNSVARLSELIPQNATRLVVIGGGVLGDLAGFAAAIRGLPTVYVPTTLLAMADSSVGGKTGVNAGEWGKNQIGMFHVPTDVLVWAGWLRTLPERELRSGMVECVKHALLSCDLDLWRGLIELAKDRHWSDIGRYLMQVVMFKAVVVEADPFELGERAILNLGHTMGHAVEALSLKVDGAAALTHGESVAIGLCHALELSGTYAGLSDANRYIKDLKESGLIPKVSAEFKQHLDDLKSFLLADKKNVGNRVHWILLRKFGEVARTDDSGWTIPLNDTQALTLSPETLTLI